MMLILKLLGVLTCCAIITCEINEKVCHVCVLSVQSTGNFQSKINNKLKVFGSTHLLIPCALLVKVSIALIPVDKFCCTEVVDTII
jgi:hypothetical protein